MPFYVFNAVIWVRSSSKASSWCCCMVSSPQGFNGICLEMHPFESAASKEMHALRTRGPSMKRAGWEATHSEPAVLKKSTAFRNNKTHRHRYTQKHKHPYSNEHVLAFTKLLASTSPPYCRPQTHVAGEQKPTLLTRTSLHWNTQPQVRTHTETQTPIHTRTCLSIH